MAGKKTKSKISKKTAPKIKKGAAKKTTPKKTVTKRKSAAKKPKKTVQHRKSVRRNPKVKSGGFWRWLFKWGFVASIWGGIFLIGIIAYYAYDLPDIDQVQKISQKPAIEIYDRHDQLIGRIGGVDGTAYHAADLPDHLVSAVIAVEDRRFYQHPGLDIRGFARAMWANIRAQRFVQGGSTLTQQLAKNLFLTPDKNIRRKVQEALLALWLEQKFTKDEILSIYLNQVYFGAGAYGIDAAAQTYFGKSATMVNLWESAVLAGLLKAPSRYSPASNPKLAAKRAETVLKAMYDAKFIDQAAYDNPNNRAHKMRYQTNYRDPSRYFIDFVMQNVENWVETNYGGLKIYTSLDLKLQNAATKIYQKRVSTYGEKDGFDQAAVMVMNNQGAILTMIGGVDYKQSQFNRATQAKRQIGSLFKPVVYLTALLEGYQASDRLVDERITRGSYRPNNFKNKYYGVTDLQTALSKSMNAATYVLAKDLTLSKILNTARILDIPKADKRDMSLILGSGTASLYDMMRMYQIFAAEGKQVSPYVIRRIENSHGTILHEYKSSRGVRKFPPRTMRKMNKMLRQTVIDGTGKAANISGLNIHGKTGTSQKSRDAWFMSFTDQVIMGVWIGNDDNSPMKDVTGGGHPVILSADIWRLMQNDAELRPLLKPSKAKRDHSFLGQVLYNFETND